ncbi:hypothetical protein O9992_03095 [Vibrio lentus]|nr:hypothetical protein [Vibrio lentus]
MCSSSARSNDEVLKGKSRRCNFCKFLHNSSSPYYRYRSSLQQNFPAYKNVAVFDTGKFHQTMPS